MSQASVVGHKLGCAKPVRVMFRVDPRMTRSMARVNALFPGCRAKRFSRFLRTATRPQPRRSARDAYACSHRSEKWRRLNAWPVAIHAASGRGDRILLRKQQLHGRRVEQ